MCIGFGALSLPLREGIRLSQAMNKDKGVLH